MTIMFGLREHGDRIAKASGTSFNYGIDPVISRVTPQGKLLGGVIYQGYTGKGGSITAHQAAFDPKWVCKDLIWICFHYPFIQLECLKLFGQTPASNGRAIKFNMKLGFQPETLVKGVFPGANGDLLVMSMRKEDCRWLTKIQPSVVRARKSGDFQVLGEHSG
jgi:RimJ/RimL family protein N-acetyltransferase